MASAIAGKRSGDDCRRLHGQTTTKPSAGLANRSVPNTVNAFISKTVSVYGGARLKITKFHVITCNDVIRPSYERWDNGLDCHRYQIDQYLPHRNGVVVVLGFPL